MVTPCPDDATLRDWLVGGLDDDESLVDHCEHCEHCERRLESLESTLRPLASHLSTAPNSEALLVAHQLWREVQRNGNDSSTEEGSTEHPELEGYKLLREIGRGGMGVVYEAMHERLSRRVAVKVLPASSSFDPILVQRFETEARAAAGFHHSNIVPVFEFGRSASCYFFSMQLIDGIGLDELTDHSGHGTAGNHTGQSRAATWFQSNAGSRYSGIANIGKQVASALGYAHQRGVIHRDVKPSNLLLDGEGRVWVTDFGLAKTQDAQLTETGAVLGTIRYMAPERLRGGICTELGDIYSLGATLYELVAQRPAFSGEDYLETLHAVSHAAAPTLRSIDARVPLDLQTIIQKAMHPDPQRRYASCEELGQDLQRFLTRQPIRARRVSAAEKLLLWSRAHKALAIALTTLVLLLAVGTIASALTAYYFYEQKQIQSGLVAEVGKRQAENRRNLYFAEMNLASPVAMSQSGVERLRELVDHWLPSDDQPALVDHRAWEWYFFASCANSEQRVISHNAPFFSVDWHPTQSWIASGGPGSVFLFAPTGEQLWYSTFDPSYAAVTALRWSPTGNALAAASHGGLLKVWDSQNKQVLAEHTAAGPIGSLCWHPTREQIAFRTQHPDLKMYVWDLSSDQVRCIAEAIAGDPSYPFAFSPDGKHLASAIPVENSQTIAVYRSSDWTVEKNFGELLWPISGIAWRPSGEQLSHASFDGSVRIWDLKAQKMVTEYSEGNIPILDLQWHPQNEFLAIAGEEKLFGLLRPDDLSDDASKSVLKPIYFKGHSENIPALSWSPDGDALVTASPDQSLRIWQIQHFPILRFQYPVEHASESRLRWSPSGEQLYAMIASNSAYWDVNNGRRLQAWYGDIVIESHDGSLRMLNGQRCYIENEANENVFELNLSKQLMQHAEWSPHQDLLALVTRDLGQPPILQVLDFSQSAAPTTRELITAETVFAIRWHPHHPEIAISYRTGASDGKSKIQIFNIATGESRVLAHTLEPFHALAWSPNGQEIAAAGDNGMFLTLRTDTGEVLREYSGHTRRINSLDWHPAGERIASASDDGTVKIWDKESGLFAASFQLQAEVRSVAWDPKGWRLAAMNAAGEAIIWSASLKYTNSLPP